MNTLISVTHEYGALKPTMILNVNAIKRLDDLQLIRIVEDLEYAREIVKNMVEDLHGGD